MNAPALHANSHSRLLPDAAVKLQKKRRGNALCLGYGSISWPYAYIGIMQGKWEHRTINRQGVLFHEMCGVCIDILACRGLSLVSSPLHAMKSQSQIQSSAAVKFGGVTHLVYTDAQTTSVVHNPEGNPELTSCILGGSKLPLGTHVDVLATKTLLQEMFPDENAHHIPSLPAKKIPYPTINPQPSSLQAKAKKLMQKAKKNMRKINFKKAVAQKFIEYDQNLEALTNFNVSEAFEKDPPNNHERENKKKRRKDAGEPSSRSSRRNRSPVKHSKPEWFLKKSRLAKKRTTWFDLFLKSDIDNENHILGPSIVAIAKKFKELIQNDELTIADLEGVGLEQLKVQYNNDVELEYNVSQLKAAVLLEAQWNSDEGYVSKPISFERHISKSIKPHPCFYNNDYTYLVDLSTDEKYTTSITKHYAAIYYKKGIEDRIPERWSKEVRRYHFEALNDIHHWEEDRIDLFKAGTSAVTEGNVYSDLRIKRSDDKEYKFIYANLPRVSVNDVEDMYLLQVQDKLHHLLLEFLKDFTNAIRMFIRRTMIKNRVEDIQLGVESYQRSLNLTKPTVFFEGIDQRIPFMMTATHKGVLSEVKKFCDGTVVKIQENMIDMLSKNKLGSDNKRLKGRDWTDYDVNSSKEILKKIDELLRHRE
ncbi:hypothetical protein Tco_0859671 [Tanacetum coccineum]|uniref:Uncharacterized protein n=1 Tax=Tanacetum coccineum TaxID=301880 RepID=A0ABQ5BGM8_9ASTR